MLNRILSGIAVVLSLLARPYRRRLAKTLGRRRFAPMST